jgi:hypothetical protein
MDDYFTVRCNGFITYCDALIARKTYNTAQSFLISLIGSPAHVQATSAHFFNGGMCRISSEQNAEFELSRWSGTVHSIRAKKIGDIVNKVMISADHFPGAFDGVSEQLTSAVVFGPDLATVKERAFLRLNNSTTMPMKPEWREWLWQEILHPEKLLAFGNRQLQEAWSISWQEETLEELILEGIQQHYLN